MQVDCGTPTTCTRSNRRGAVHCGSQDVTFRLVSAARTAQDSMMPCDPPCILNAWPPEANMVQHLVYFAWPVITPSLCHGVIRRHLPQGLHCQPGPGCHCHIHRVYRHDILVCFRGLQCGRPAGRGCSRQGRACRTSQPVRDINRQLRKALATAATASRVGILAAAVPA